MPIADMVLLLGAGALVVAVAAWIGRKADRRGADREAERRGRENGERLRRTAARRCVGCDREVDPAVDVFSQDAWWCQSCWLNVIR
jgi:hypothetical protein